MAKNEEKGLFKNLVKNQGLKQLLFCMIKPGVFRSIFSSVRFLNKLRLFNYIENSFFLFLLHRFFVYLFSLLRESFGGRFLE